MAKPAVRFARFILHPNVASRRYLYRFWNPMTLNGVDAVAKKGGNVIKKSALKPGATPQDVQRYKEAVAANGGNDKVKFRSVGDPGPGQHEVVHITNDRVVAAYLRNEIREGRLKAREDVTVAPLACPWCDFVRPSSTPNDHEEMYRHHLDVHPEKLDDMVGQPMPTAQVVA